MSLEESWRDLDPHHPSEYDEQSPEYWEKKNNLSAEQMSEDMRTKDAIEDEILDRIERERTGELSGEEQELVQMRMDSAHEENSARTVPVIEEVAVPVEDSGKELIPKRIRIKGPKKIDSMQSKPEREETFYKAKKKLNHPRYDKKKAA